MKTASSSHTTIDEYIAAFPLEVRRRLAKGSVQFPHDEPLPLELVGAIVKFRVAENARSAKR
jgi:uncharacterized protein YdhG (YjbR/CyaY superfamily)